MAEPAERFVEYRDDLLDLAEARGFPPIAVAGGGVVEGRHAWLAAVEASTGTELIELARALAELEADD